MPTKSACSILAALVWGSLSLAQSNTLQRPHDPVLLRGQALPALLSIPPGQIVAFRYRSGWEQIPVQVDERKVVDFGVVYGTSPTGLLTTAYVDASTYTGADTNALFDADDELVFMARDAGGRALPATCLPAGVLAGSGVEIALADPLTNGVGYVYLFRTDGSLSPDAGRDYVGYNFNLLAGSYFSNYNTWNGPNPEDSIISNAFYRTHFSDRWICDEVNVYAGGANGLDILDRHKNMFAPGNCTRTENTFSAGEGAFFANKDGPVRALRSYLGANSGPLTQRDHFFYERRQDIVTCLRVHAIPGMMDVYDYSLNATGMVYFNNLNTNGVTIDGMPDAVLTGPVNWEMVTGPQGSLLISARVQTDVVPFPPTSYYSDDTTPSVTQCTGDPFEYGTSGLRITNAIPNTDPALGATNQLTGIRIVYYEPPGQTVPAAILRNQQATTPLSATNRVFLGDSDCDQLPDAWELARLGTVDHAGGQDSDGDGHSNLWEYVTGTDPNSPADYFTLEISGPAGGVVVSFTARATSGPGYEGLKRIYCLERSEGLTAPDWVAVPGYENILGENQTVSYNETVATDAERFYRASARLAQ